MISVRLDQDTENALRSQLRERDLPLSEFVREAIREKLERLPTPPTPYELGATLFGRERSGQSDRSLRRKTMIRERIDAKHRR